MMRIVTAAWKADTRPEIDVGPDESRLSSGSVNAEPE